MTTLEEIRVNVAAVNTPLGKPYLDKDNVEHPAKVLEMTPVLLLRHCHPSFRSEWAHRLYKEEVITEEQAREFTKIVKV